MLETDQTIAIIAGKHLGKTSSGETMQPYSTPDKHDSSLLVAIPRDFNRIKENITSSFIGYDAWQAYETSFLLNNGMPVTGILRVSYPADSPNIVESKSLKLYLNSFNMEKIGDNMPQSIKLFDSIVKDDLSATIGASVSVKFLRTWSYGEDLKSSPICINYPQKFQYLDDCYLKSNNNTPLDDFDGHLETYFTEAYEGYKVYTDILRSNCEITHQPDTGTLYLVWLSRKSVRSTSLLKYIISFRNKAHFHENCCEIIYDFLNKELEPLELLVGCFYNRRGGIDINPVRASSQEFLQAHLYDYDNVNKLFEKTFQQ